MRKYLAIAILACGTACGSPPLAPALSPEALAVGHSFSFGMEGKYDATGYADFRALEPGSANEKRLCHVYTHWNVASEPQTLSPLLTWFTGPAASNCDEVTVTFQGEQIARPGPSEAPPSAAAYRSAFAAFLRLALPDGKLAAWHGKLSFTAWNEPNNPNNAGNGLNQLLPPERAAEYYLIARSLCADVTLGPCTVAAGDFATSGVWGQAVDPAEGNSAGSIELNCATDDIGGLADDGTRCTASGPHNPAHWEPSYLDRYKYFIARNWDDTQGGERVYPGLPDGGHGFRPEVWAYHPWQDVNDYIASPSSACSDYDHCATRRLLASLREDSSWSGSAIWDTEIAVGQKASVEISPARQACGAAFLVQLTDLDPRIERVYYEWFAFDPALHGELFDGGGARPAAGILANRQMNDPDSPCDATGLVATYSNPIIPMFKLEGGSESSAPTTEYDTEGCPDPTGMKTHLGMYYLYCTSYSLQYRRLSGFPIFKADSLGGGPDHWSRAGNLIAPSRSFATWPSWIERGNGDFWAPDVHEVRKTDGTYVYIALYAAPHEYYYLHRGKTGPGVMQSIGLAWSDSPEGPWTHQQSMFISACGSDGARCRDNTPGHPAPQANRNNGSGNTTGTYDPNLLVSYDAAGAPLLYLYWTVAGKGIFGQQVFLKSPTGPGGELAVGASPLAIHVAPFGEGAYVIERPSSDIAQCDSGVASATPTAGSCFYLFYSTSADPAHSLLFSYEVGVRRSSDPLRPLPWLAGPAKPVVQRSPGALPDGSPARQRSFMATGGCSVIQNAVDGTDFMVYHAILVPESHYSCVNIEDPSGAPIEKSVLDPYCRGQGERQAMMDPIYWSEDGWPVVNGEFAWYDGTPSTSPAPLL